MIATRNVTAAGDSPHVRASETCPLCSRYKPRGLVACWPCYRGHDLRNGNPEAEQTIAAREAYLAAQVTQ